jgi:hypothetical protein
MYKRSPDDPDALCARLCVIAPSGNVPVVPVDPPHPVNAKTATNTMAAPRNAEDTLCSSLKLLRFDDGRAFPVLTPDNSKPHGAKTLSTRDDSKG